MRIMRVLLGAALLFTPAAGQGPPAAAGERDRRVAAIHERFVFADIHAHPSAFHRSGVERIETAEIARYKRGLIDLVVANVSSDAAFQGGYTRPDGTRVPRLQGNDVHPLQPGDAFAFTLERMSRVLKTIEAGDAVLASSPDAVLAAKRAGKVALMPALEGADGLEGRLENLRELHRRGLRLVQLMHFLDSDIGSNQTPPHDARGLTPFGRELVREANRLGIIVDLAHANTRTIMDALETSTQPILFSHTGVKALHQGDRYLSDDEIRAIAAKGGVIGIWPAAALRTIPEMIRHIDHVKRLAGIDHIAIASDLRGMSYIDAFGEEANFRAIVDGLLDAGFADDEVGKIMGGNFFRAWQQVARGSSQSSQAATYDVLLKNGRIVDGTGSPWYRGDVAIRGDAIVRIAPSINESAARVIDVRGQVIAPGFIDIHSHARRGIFEVPTAENYIRQGVATAIEGPDGGSPIPLAPFLARVDSLRKTINFGAFIGQGSIRQSVIGEIDRKATPDEITRMRSLVEQGMRDGAFGLSSGLFYVPGIFTPTEEVIELAKVAGRFGGIHISHMRDEAAGVVTSVQETIRIGEEGGLPTQVTHHKVVGPGYWGRSVETLKLVEEARARGVDATIDQYPYTASSTSVSSALLPAWALEGGQNAVLQRLKDPATRARIKTETARIIRLERGGGDPKNVVLSRCEWDASLAGKSLADVARLRGMQPTIENGAEAALWITEQGGCGGIFHAINEQDLERILKYPGTMIASDGEVPVFGRSHPHPRSYGTFARVLGHYVREKKAITLEDAVRKMSSYPAKRLGIQDRGVLQPGMKADIAVFDPARIRDVATFERPHQYAEGVSYVLVNGQLVLDGGTMTTARPGRVLYGPAHQPGARTSTTQSPSFQALSLLGDTLRTLPLTAEVRARYQRQLEEARVPYERTPTDVDSIIWYGRRLAYLGQLREAIDVYTRGIALHPDNPWLYRHRGHRYISVREFDRAIADLERAAKLVEGKPDVVEPDGQPNPRNIPIGSLHSNINYHLALAYYLKGDYAKALPIYQRDVAAAKNDDRLVSTSHWLYMSLRRLNRNAEAARVLAPIRKDMNVIENEAYHRLLLLYKGELPQDSVLRVGPTGEMSVTDATAAYGVGNWHLYNGRRAEAEQIFRRIIAGGQWGAFGYIAAEAELARMRRR
jgi:N-acyl-D-amino-acid deacylase